MKKYKVEVTYKSKRGIKLDVVDTKEGLFIGIPITDSIPKNYRHVGDLVLEQNKGQLNLKQITFLLW